MLNCLVVSERDLIDSFRSENARVYRPRLSQSC